MAVVVAQKKMIEQYGPYGSQCPENYSFQLQHGESIKEVIIRHGFIVDAIGFVVAKQCGGTYTKMFGGNLGKESRIVLKPGEQIIQISGTYGNYKYQSNQCLVATMKIHTNFCLNGYGPYGQGKGVECARNFSSPLPIDGPIVGVFGRHNNYLESVGIFIKKMSQDVEKYGPYGCHTGQQWSMMLEPCEYLTEMIIKTGAVVDSIVFVTKKPSNCGWITNRRKFGGNGGNAEHKITLQCDELVNNVSGWVGEWHENRDLTKLKIHTNKRKEGYGPYGGGPYTKYLYEFASQVPCNGRVVGFFGTLHNNYVESIGLYVQKAC